MKKTSLILPAVTEHNSGFEMHHKKKKKPEVFPLIFFTLKAEAQLQYLSAAPCNQHPLMNACHSQTAVGLCHIQCKLETKGSNTMVGEER